MKLLDRARRLESKIARSVDEAARRVAKSGGRTPLEIIHAIVDAVDDEVQPAGRGQHVFPFNRMGVSVVAGSPEARARFQAILETPPTLRERLLERLQSLGCAVSALDVHVAYVPEPRPDWSDDGFDIELGRIAHEVHVIPPKPSHAHRIELTVIEGCAQHPAYSLAMARIDLGRGAAVRDAHNRLVRTNHVAFVDGGEAANQSVSRHHAHIACDPASGGFRVHDDGSVHGTSVVRDGRAVRVPSGSRGVLLRTGDEIALGDARLAVTINPSAR